MDLHITGPGQADIVGPHIDVTAKTGVSSAGELSHSRMEALEDLDPGWCPMRWDVSWQRNYRLALAHVKAGGALPGGPREVVVQGEDLGVWIAGQKAAWPQLTPAQAYLLETLGVDPDDTAGARPAPRSQDDRWAANLAAARQFRAREGHLRPARKHLETITVGVGGDGGQEVAVRLGAWLDNTRRRAAKLSPERRADLDALGTRWS
ncbi:helicase associated domain-containing protein [Streptomyces sp. R41]|uniref:Helicase associated domain-containing protein n=1 Tax=Streptomyces sp. R41 TaxID=3238632 RepID=A0AB39R7I4_9ACTN